MMVFMADPSDVRRSLHNEVLAEHWANHNAGQKVARNHLQQHPRGAHPRAPHTPQRKRPEKHTLKFFMRTH